MEIDFNSLCSGIIGAAIACIFTAILQRANQKHQEKMQERQFEHEQELERLRQRKDDDRTRENRNSQQTGSFDATKMGAKT